MKKIALTLTLVTVLAAPAAASAGGLWPHVYSTKITGATPAVLNGTWRLSLQKAAFSVTKGGAAALSGSLTIAGNRVTFRDLAGPFACRGSQVTGTYTWRLQGNTLTPVSDKCTGRRTILTRPFTLV